MKTITIKIFLLVLLLSSGIVDANAAEIKYNLAKKQGIVLYKKHEFAKALEAFNSIPQLVRDDETSVLISNIYIDYGKNADAEKLLAQIAEKKSLNASVYYNLGILQYNSNKIEEAAKNFKHATILSKDFMPAYYNLGNCYFKLKQYKKAAKAYEGGLNIIPDNTELLYNAALTYKKLKKEKEAQKYLETYNMLTAK